jgi:hypothetical protein
MNLALCLKPVCTKDVFRLNASPLSAGEGLGVRFAAFWPFFAQNAPEIETFQEPLRSIIKIRFNQRSDFLVHKLV